MVTVLQGTIYGSGTGTGTCGQGVPVAPESACMVQPPGGQPMVGWCIAGPGSSSGASGSSSGSPMTLSVGQTRGLMVGGSGLIHYKGVSSNPAIATIVPDPQSNESFKVTGVAVGTATLTVTDLLGNVTTILVTVT